MSPNFEVVVKEAPHYNKYPCTGVWGGPVAGNYIMVSFSLDYPKTKVNIEMRLDNEGVARVETDSSRTGDDGKQQYIKELQTAVLLTPNDARAIGKWLIEQAELINPTSAIKV